MLSETATKEKPSPNAEPDVVLRRKVLLVEDDEGQAFLTRRMLGQVDGWVADVTHVETLRAAAQHLHDVEYDVVLLDLSLPDSMGIETVRAVCTAAKSVPIVVLSGSGNEKEALHSVQVGAQDFINKDRVDARGLSWAVRYAIERKQSERRLLYLAHHDGLTGLANRTLFLERLEQALTRAPRNKTRVAMLYLDLDKFKAINDQWGHDAGDAVLIEVAKRLESCVRQGETVARIGGDEFTVALDGVRRLDDAVAAARRILDAFQKPFDIGGRMLCVQTSIGIAVSSESGLSTADMFERADRAMYRAKKDGRNNFRVFTDEPDITTGDLFDTNCEVERALEDGELRLVYQPKFDVANDTIVGLEALLRWEHPRLGLLGPDDFIGPMERAGVISNVGRWVLDTAIKQMRIWIDQGRSDFRLAVNVSARQLEDDDFVTFVTEALQAYDVSPDFLELEITESILIEQSAHARDVLTALRDIGILIALDDFGTGFGSLAYLVSYPIDILKIDRSFVDGIEDSPRHRAIITAIIGLGQSLGLEVVAEGVETKGQLDEVLALGCRIVQGYLLGVPVRPEAL